MGEAGNPETSVGTDQKRPKKILLSLNKGAEKGAAWQNRKLLDNSHSTLDKYCREHPHRL